MARMTPSRLELRRQAEAAQLGKTVEEMREDRNKAARDRRHQRHLYRYENGKAGLIKMFDDSLKNHVSHDQLLVQRNQRGFVGIKPMWISEKLSAVWDTLITLHYRHLVFCYPHPDTGVITPAKELGDAGFAGRVDTDAGRFYYRNEDGSYSDPF